MIRWKAFVMLVAFAASFTVFCHCEPVEAASCCKRSCCEKKKKDDHGCQGMQAVKLNLQEKQAVAVFHVEAAPMVLVERGASEWNDALRPVNVHSRSWAYRLFSNRQSFYKCFLI
jgi:hypothetical protein